MKQSKTLFIIILVAVVIGLFLLLDQQFNFTGLNHEPLPPSDPGVILESAAPVVSDEEVQKAGL